MAYIRRCSGLILMMFVCIDFPAYAQISPVLDSLLRQSIPYSFIERWKHSATLPEFTSTKPLGIHAEAIRKHTYESKDTLNKSGIWIHFQGEQFQYVNKSLHLYDEQSESYRLANIKWLDKTLVKTVKALKKLEKRSPYAHNIIRTLQNSENQFIIEVRNCGISYTLLPLSNNKWGALNNNAYAFQALETKKPLVTYAPFDRIGSGAKIRWFPKDGIMQLAHELAHAYDANFGLLDDRLKVVNGNAMVSREIRALYHENNIRIEMGRRYREKVQYGNAWIANGKPFTYQIPYFARY